MKSLSAFEAKTPAVGVEGAVSLNYEPLNLYSSAYRKGYLQALLPSMGSNQKLETEGKDLEIWFSMDN